MGQAWLCAVSIGRRRHLINVVYGVLIALSVDLLTSSAAAAQPPDHSEKREAPPARLANAPTRTDTATRTEAATLAAPRSASRGTVRIVVGDVHVQRQRNGRHSRDPWRPSRLAQREAAHVFIVPRSALEQQSRDLSDALDTVPGLRVVRVGGHGATSQVQVRGSTSTQSLVTLGDIPLRSPTGRPVDLEAIPLVALRGVELWRSRAPASLGDTPIGGVIRLRPRRLRPGVEVRGGYGSYGASLVEGRGAWGGRRQGGGSINLRWLTGRGDYPYVHDSGTPLDRSDDRVLRRGNNQIQRLSGLIEQHLRLGPTWRLGLTWLGGWRAQGLPGLAVAEASRANLDAQNHDVVLRLSAKGANAAKEVWMRVGTERLRVVDRLGELGPVQERTQAIRAAEVGVRWRRSSGAIRPRVAASVRAGGVATEDLLAERASPEARQAAASLSLGADLRGKRWRLAPTLRGLVVGGRRFEDQGWVARWTALDSPIRGLLSAEVGGSFRVTKQWQLRAGLAMANRPPTLIELFGNDGTVRPAPRLRDERALTATLASTLRLGDRQRGATVAASGFLSQRTDLIQLVRAGPSQVVYTNIGQAAVGGAEIALRGRWGTHLAADAAWALLIGRDRSERRLYSGNALPLRPATRWHTAISWQKVALTRQISAGIRLAARWQAGSFADRANLVIIPGRTQVDTGVHIKGTVWRASLRLDNLLDAPRFDRVGLPLPGRIWMFNLAWHREAK